MKAQVELGMYVKKPKGASMDGQDKKALWSRPKGLTSQLMPGSSGDILQVLEQDQVLAL